MSLIALRALTRLVLSDPHKYDWTIQGFGLLRMHMDGDARFHIWDHSRAYHNVSMIHDHAQWGLHSTIVCGALTNVRFVESDVGIPYNHMRIIAGAGGRPLEEPSVIKLRAQERELYGPGDCYFQQPDEIHITTAKRGTVTVMQKFPTADGTTARVFWPIGKQWGSAEPRKATKDEIESFVSAARERLPELNYARRHA